MRLLGGVFKLLLRDPAVVNALKPTCVIIFLAFYMIRCSYILYDSMKTPVKTPEKSYEIFTLSALYTSVDAFFFFFFLHFLTLREM